jgi:hypothetical protein
MTEYYSVVTNNVTSTGLLDILEKTTANQVVIMSELEWELPGLTIDVIQAYKNRNVDLSVLLCGFDTPNSYQGNIFWPTYWVNWSHECLRCVKVDEFDIDKVTKPFITLNNRSHYHRCVFIDEMAKKNLIDKGVVSWVKHLNENSDYPYKHFDNRQILLNDDFNNKLDSFLIPDQYNTSLFNVVVEATSQSVFITEKTIIPTFLKKPYIVLGAQGFNSKLVELGFKLYDEVFDYSFDNESDIFKRTELFVNNVHKTLEIDLKKTYEIILPKIIYNYNRAHEIVKDKTLIPDIVKECAAQADIDHSVFSRYIKFLND